LLESEIGYFEKGYLDMCGMCKGKEAVKYLIPAAERLINEKRIYLWIGKR